MRIGEVARRAGVNVETLRYYERRGLLEEPARGPAGHRRYREDTVRFVRAIKEAQGLGFSLAEIEELLRAIKRGSAPEALRIRLAAKIDEVDAKIAALHRVRDGLARVVGCACESLDHCTCGAAYLARRGGAAESAGPLHVTNGESAGNTLRQTSLGGSVLPWQDSLHEGPVPLVPAGPLRRVRAMFLSECGWGDARSIRAELERRDQLYLEALAAGRQVVLWFEPDLYDQLQLAQALALAPAGSQIELIDAGVSLGPLPVEELERLWPDRRPVDDETLGLARAAWDAVRAPDPLAMDQLAGSGSGALPHLAPALVRFLEELPAVGDGLSRTERQLLEELDAGSARPLKLFARCQGREEAPFLGDSWFFRILSALGESARPLVTTLGPPPPLADPNAYRQRVVELTEHGRSVLAGEADRVELLGLDRWLGGTHLHDENVWRWDREARRVVSARAGA